MATRVMAAAYFTALQLGQLGRAVKLQVLAQHLATAAKRIFGAPEFHLSTIADGIEQIPYASLRGFGPSESATVKPGDTVLLLPFES